MKLKKETSAVGDIATYSGNGLTITSDLDPQQTKKRNAVRKKMNNKGNAKQQPKEFTKLEAKRNERRIVEQIARQEVVKIICEQGTEGQIMDLYDNISKMLNLSLQYCRVFMADGLKLGNDALEYNFKRSKSEISRISKLVRDLDQMLVQIYSQSKKNNEEEYPDENDDGKGGEVESCMGETPLKKEGFIKLSLLDDTKKKRINKSVLLEQSTILKTDWGRNLADWAQPDLNRNDAVKFASEFETIRSKHTDLKSSAWKSEVQRMLNKIGMNDPRTLKYFMQKFSR